MLLEIPTNFRKEAVSLCFDFEIPADNVGGKYGLLYCFTQVFVEKILSLLSSKKQNGKIMWQLP